MNFMDVIHLTVPQIDGFYILAKISQVKSLANIQTEMM